MGFVNMKAFLRSAALAIFLASISAPAMALPPSNAWTGADAGAGGASLSSFRLWTDTSATSGPAYVTGTEIAAFAALSAPVQSVAGRGGLVTLAYTDIGGLAAIAHSGSWTDLSGRPTIPTLLSQLTNDSGYITGITSGMVTTALGFTPQNAATAFNGTYANLTGKPTIPAAQVNSDWSATSGVAQILNKPAIPTLNSQLTNDSGYITTAPTTLVTINRSGGTAPTAQTYTNLQVVGGPATDSRVEQDTFQGTALFTGVEAEGTVAAPAATASGRVIASLNAWGYNGSAFVGPKGSMRLYSPATWTSTSNPTEIDFNTTPTGYTVAQQRMVLANDGGLYATAATGGDKGPGTANFVSLYQNGVAVTAFSTATANVYTAQQNFGTSPLLMASGLQWNLNSAQEASITLTGPSTLNAPTGQVNGGNYKLRIVQDGTGGRTLVYNAVYKFPGGTIPTLTTAAGAVDVLSCASDGTNMDCVLTQDFR